MAGSSPPLTLRLLGACEVRVHGRPLPPPRYRKEHWLLALLAVRHDREATRDVLAALFWPEAEGSQARYYLRRSLSNLRRALGSEAGRLLTPAPRTVQLDMADAECDLLAFDAALAQAAASAAPEQPLQQAISLYRGPFLPACLDEWALIERNQREQSYLAALERLARITLAKGEPAAAVRWLRLLVTVDPYRESATCALLQALADSGDRAAMQQVYQELRRRLRDDLNAAPAPETEALYEHLNRCGARFEFPSAAGVPGLSAPPVPTSPRHLPVPMTDLIGREQEIEEVAGRLALCRLVTLFGTGGVGKTRLAIAVAERVLPLFPDGVWLVDLAPLTRSLRVAEATARALGLREEEGRSPEERLTDALAARTLLIVLDNCEHVLDDCAALATLLLSTCSGLRVLATSRHVLRADGEQLYPVPSLALPPAERKEARGGLATAEEGPASLLSYAGIRLFVQRAAQARPAFKLDRRNGAAVAAICRHLDGIPLAIEMAAARLRSLSVSEIDRRLSDRFRLLTSGNRVALPRQQTLRATLDWSYDLLDTAERDLLCRLSVFAGGCTLEAAEAVVSGQWLVVSGRHPTADGSEPSPGGLTTHHRVLTTDVSELLASLVDKSLVVYEDGEYPRYRMLETVRQYAAEQVAPDERGELARRHTAFFLALAERADRAADSEEGAERLQEVQREYDNMRAALDGCVQASPSDGGGASWEEVGLALGAVLSSFWITRCYFAEGRRYLMSLLARSEGKVSRARARALAMTGRLAQLQDGGSAAAYRLLEEGLAMARALKDQPLTAQTLLFILDQSPRHLTAAQRQALCEEALTLYAELGDRRGRSVALITCGLTSLAEDARRAEALFEEGRVILRELGSSRALAWACHHLGYARYLVGEYEPASAVSRESLPLFEQYAELVGIAACHDLQGRIALAQGDLPTARQHFMRSREANLQLGSRSGVSEAPMACNCLGDVALAAGDMAAAESLYHEALTIGRSAGQSIIHGLTGLGRVALRRGDARAAASQFVEALSKGRDWGCCLLMLSCLEGLADAFIVEDGLERSGGVDPGPLATGTVSPRLLRAARLLSAAQAARERIGVGRPTAEQSEHEDQVTALRASLGEAGFTEAWAAGQALSWDETMALVLGERA